MLNPQIEERIRELEEKSDDDPITPDEIRDILGECQEQYQY